MSVKGLIAAAGCALAVSLPADQCAKAFAENLRRVADSGRFVYSWTHPWLETDPATT